MQNNQVKQQELPYQIYSNSLQQNHPQWYIKTLQSNQPINFSRFENKEEAVNFYSQEANKLFIANKILQTKLTQALKEKQQLADLLANAIKSQKNDSQQKRRRHRRCASEIQRRFVCSVQHCRKSYGTEGSLSQHMKLKHPDVVYNPEGNP